MAYEGDFTGSPPPVMTFQAGGSWLAVRVEQVDRVALAPRLWPVPLARPEHVGLLDSGGELVPVLHLDDTQATCTSEQMVALLHVRGESVGLAIDRAGRLYDRYRIDQDSTADSPALAAVQARRAVAGDHSFWLIDADRLFDFDSVAPRS